MEKKVLLILYRALADLNDNILANFQDLLTIEVKEEIEKYEETLAYTKGLIQAHKYFTKEMNDFLLFDIDSGVK